MQNTRLQLRRRVFKKDALGKIGSQSHRLVVVGAIFRDELRMVFLHHVDADLPQGIFSRLDGHATNFAQLHSAFFRRTGFDFLRSDFRADCPRFGHGSNAPCDGNNWFDRRRGDARGGHQVQASRAGDAGSGPGQLWQ